MKHASSTTCSLWVARSQYHRDRLHYLKPGQTVKGSCSSESYMTAIAQTPSDKVGMTEDSVNIPSVVCSCRQLQVLADDVVQQYMALTERD